MRRLVLAAVTAMWLTGCGGHGAEYTAVAMSIAKTLVEIVQEQTGKTPDELKHECETEFSRDEKRVFVLCTFETK